jgi:hypothetical protein
VCCTAILAYYFTVVTAAERMRMPKEL